MKSFKDILLETTTTANIPSDVVTAWKKVTDYDAKMKRKFTYFDVAFKSRAFTPGHKGHMTKAQNHFEKTMKEHGLDPNQTVKKLFNLYPPKHI